MTDATDRTGDVFVVPPGVQLKSPDVNVKDIDPILQSFLITAGLVHMHLFNQLLIVTSGKDSIHVAGSKHAEGKAIDLRIMSLPPDQAPCWLLCLRILSARYRLAVFDESYVPGMGHVHVEIAG